MEACCVAAVRQGVMDVIRVELPQVGQGEVLIQVDFSYLSPGTEGWIIRGCYNPEGDERLFPCLLGYQAVGKVIEAGPGTTLKHGQPVFTWGGNAVGVRALYAAHASHVVCSEENVIPLVPEAPHYADISALVVAQVGYNAGTCLTLERGAKVWIIGEGIIGQFTLQALLWRGARVLVSGLDPFRLEIARRSGAAVIVNAQQGGEEAIREFAGDGLDAVVDTVGLPSLAEQWLALLRRGGAFVHVASNPDGYLIDLRKIKQPKEITVYNPDGITRERLRETLRLIREGILDVDRVTSHTVRPDEVPQLYAQLLEHAGEVLGVRIDWRQHTGR